jgi:hypothetical protein
MATFPSLTPASRTFTPGSYPHTPFQTLSGLQRRVLHTDAMVSSTLSCGFIALSEADMLLVISHYQGQFGAFTPFDIPSTILQGFTLADFQLSGYLWRYSQPPQITDRCGPTFDVSITLETVPPESMTAAGATLTLSLLLSPGAVTASSSAPGASLTMTLSIDGGLADAPGAALTLTQTLAPGAATSS